MRDERRQALAKVLVKVAANIEKLQQRRSHIGEQDTKTILINPILGALGWDLQSIDDVSQEYRHKPKDNPVDYALFFLRQPCLFVEAKALDSNLDDRKWISQTISYATIAGVEWCILTNGAEYRLYNAHAPVAVDEKLFRIVRVADAPSDPYTIETLELLSKDKIGENLLNVFWKVHFVDRQVKAVFEDIIRNQDKSLVRLLKKKTDGLLSSQIEQSLKRAEVAIDFPTISVSPAVVPEKSAKKEETKESSQASGKTYAFSNQWGGQNWHKAMGLLKEKYSQFKIDFSAAS